VGAGFESLVPYGTNPNLSTATSDLSESNATGSNPMLPFAAFRSFTWNLLGWLFTLPFLGAASRIILFVCHSYRVIMHLTQKGKVYHNEKP
jgi:hypothetical protein